ncbi:MarR family winged helix-turn-helix transcriptional regulator [Actinomadura sp. HBU206391]|uniref:MarR family winged helix-turn-helix transcriptional regulator n=1 Tax=Actinomadura sp. HBU206391 TaxID=2731692 RepID=UPI001650428E|nr:MarR family winged helix-turn-helix transcriptional regulator [Actinomadura sp. HBU206391]MBC6459727.1 winged helix-turn-helix transcriptional regulator [Actinomadura sp. HBU206391]
MATSPPASDAQGDGPQPDGPHRAGAHGPGERPSVPGLNADLGWALGVVFRSYVKAVDALFSDLPGGPRGYQLLASAAHDLAGNQGLLSQQLGIDRTVLTYLIDDLEELGLVERRPDPADRRSRQVIATDKGRALWSQRQEALRHVEQHVLGALGDDGPAFRALLQRLAAGANELDPITSVCAVVEQLMPADATGKATGRANRRR